MDTENELYEDILTKLF